MRKLIFLFLLLFLPVFIFATVVVPQNIPEDIASVISDSIDDNDRGREDVDFIISNYNEESIGDDIGISFTLDFLDRSITIDVLAARKDIGKAISNRIGQALFYEDTLYPEVDEKLDYIYSGSFSFFPSKDYRRGTTFIAKDEMGKTKGVFEINHQYSDVDELQPIYVSKNLKPGMALSKSSSLRYSLSIATNFYVGSLGFSAELGSTNLIYPFIPTLSIVFETRQGRNAIYGGIGIAGYIDLNDFMKSSFTLIQEGRIGASASLLLGSDSGEFAYNGFFSIYYEHRLLPKFMWRVGYAKYPMLGHSLIFGIGGSF